MSIVNPSQARKVFYQLLKDVNKTNEPIYISGKNEESEAVMVSKKDWDAIKINDSWAVVVFIKDYYSI